MILNRIDVLKAIDCDLEVRIGDTVQIDTKPYHKTYSGKVRGIDNESLYLDTSMGQSVSKRILSSKIIHFNDIMNIEILDMVEI